MDTFNCGFRNYALKYCNCIYTHLGTASPLSNVLRVLILNPATLQCILRDESGFFSSSFSLLTPWPALCSLPKALREKDAKLRPNPCMLELEQNARGESNKWEKNACVVCVRVRHVRIMVTFVSFKQLHARKLVCIFLACSIALSRS